MTGSREPGSPGDGRHEPAVLVTTGAGIRWITMNRPEKRNALDRALISGLKSALREADADDSVRVVALRGAGVDFCSGADLAELREASRGDVLDSMADVDSLAELFTLPRRLSKPVAAVVHGRALAGGCGLATSCDLVLAADTSVFGYPEVRIGFVPAMVMAILRRNVGEKRAFEMVVVGGTLTGGEAERVGLVNRIYPEASLVDGAGEFLGELATRSASAVALSKRLLYHQDGMSFEAAIRAGADLNVIARTTEDTRAGLDGFLASREQGR